MKDQLYLLRPGFTNATLGPFYCGDSVSVEGLLSFFPKLREEIDVHYIDFARPRRALVEALGEDWQSVPVLILAPARTLANDQIEFQEAKGNRFLADEAVIRRYLSTQYGYPIAG